MTGDRAAIKARLLRAKKQARRELDLILAESSPTLEFLYTRLRQYILFCYLLDETCCFTDNINEIMLISLERALKLDRNIISETEKGGACDRATPIVTKRILLFISLQTELKTALPPDALARTETIMDLAEVIWGQLERKAHANN